LPIGKRKESDVDEKMLRIKQVLKIIPVSKSTWWAGVKSGKFPKPMKLGARTTVWLLSDIQALVEETIGSSQSHIRQ